MPTEPERDIEKTLKAYAGKRREQAGAPLELHPATRRLLQGEVARSAPRKVEQSAFWPGLLARLRPRVVYASILTVVVVICAIVFLPPFHHGEKPEPASFELAKRKEFAAPPASAAATQPAGPPVLDNLEKLSAGESDKEVGANTPRLGNADKKEATQLRDEAAAPASPPSLALTVPPPAAAAPPPNAGGLSQRVAPSAPAVTTAAPRPSPVPSANSYLATTVTPQAGHALEPAGTAAAAPTSITGVETRSYAYKNNAEVTASRRALQAVPSAAPAALSLNEPTSTPASKQTTTDSSSGTAKSFYRAQAGSNDRGLAGKATNSAAILDSFRLEQTGDQVRVVDSDGSIYSGFLKTSDKTAVTDAEGLSDGVASMADRQKVVTEAYSDATKQLAKDSPTNVQSFFFRVTGTNRTLQQPVVFSGSWTPNQSTTTNFGAVNANRTGGTGGKAAAVSGTLAAPLANKAQIRGRAVVGSRVIEVNASPAY